MFQRSFVLFIFVALLAACSRSNEVIFPPSVAEEVFDCSAPSLQEPLFSQLRVYSIGQSGAVAQDFVNIIELSSDRVSANATIQRALSELVVFSKTKEINDELVLGEGFSGLIRDANVSARTNLVESLNIQNDKENVVLVESGLSDLALSYSFKIEYQETRDECAFLAEEVVDEGSDDEIASIRFIRDFSVEFAIDIGFTRRGDELGALVMTDAPSVAYNVDDSNDQPFMSASSVSTNGLYKVIGYPYSDSTITSNLSSENSGVVVIYQRDNETGEFAQCNSIKAPGYRAEDLFGMTVLVRENRLYVSAPGDDGGASGPSFLPEGLVGNVDEREDSGAVYVFELDQSCNVSEFAYLKNPWNDRSQNILTPDTGFGSSISVWGDKIFVSAPSQISDLQDGVSLGPVGIVVEYSLLPNDTWEVEIYESPVKHLNEQFGRSLSVNEKLLVIGSDNDGVDVNAIDIFSSVASVSDVDMASNIQAGSGAATVYYRKDSGFPFIPLGYLKPEYNEAGDRFGRSIAVYGDSIFVGAPFEDGASNSINVSEADNSRSNSGAVYRFQLFEGTDDNDIRLMEYIKSRQPTTQANFGAVISAERKFLAVANDGAASDFGVHGVTNSHLELIDYTTYDDPQYLAVFENENSNSPLDARVESIDLYGGTLVLGLPEATVNGQTNAGAFAVWE